MKLKSKQLLIETTNICDAHCVICPREQFRLKPMTMSMELFRKIIDDAAQYEVECIDTCGYGEAFLDKHLFERLAYIRGRLPKAKTFVSTTAFHMDSETWDNVIKYIDTLKLSIYGVSRETYEAFHRGRVKHGQVMRNILGFLNHANGTRPHTVGLFVPTELNQHETGRWLTMWEPLLDEVFIWKPHNWVSCRSYRMVDKTRQKTCGRPLNGPMYIRADGTVTPCCWDINNDIVLGDLNYQTIEEIYKGQPYKDIKEAHLKGDFSKYICQNCDQTNYNPDVLIYANDKTRKVGQLTANKGDLL